MLLQDKMVEGECMRLRERSVPRFSVIALKYDTSTD
jgi:hypothetical protein